MPDDIQRTHNTDDKTKFVKEEHENTDEFILQKNKKTKLGIVIIVIVLILLIIGVWASGVFMGDPK